MEVRDESGDPRGGPALVEAPAVKYRTGQGTLGAVWDG